MADEPIERTASVEITYGAAWKEQPTIFLNAKTLPSVMLHPQLAFNFDKLNLVKIELIPCIQQARVNFAELRYWVLALEGGEFPADGVFDWLKTKEIIRQKYTLGQLKLVCVAPA